MYVDNEIQNSTLTIKRR